MEDKLIDAIDWVEDKINRHALTSTVLALVLGFILGAWWL